MSLNSSNFDEQEEIRKESKIVEVKLSENEVETETSIESDDTDLDTTDSDSDDVTEATNENFPKPVVNREHAI